MAGLACAADGRWSVPGLTAAMLERGTRRFDRMGLARELEDHGLQLTVSASGDGLSGHQTFAIPCAGEPLDWSLSEPLDIMSGGSTVGRILERARRKIHSAVERYGYWGLMVFVAIPLPLTGAYTGAIGAWVLGMRRWKSILFIALGVAIAGVVVSLVFLLGIRPLFLFLKK